MNNIGTNSAVDSMGEALVSIEIPWNNSMGLLEKCPSLREDGNWRDFSDGYDRPEKQHQRILDCQNSHPSWAFSSDLMDLKTLADFILSGRQPEIFIPSILKGHDVKSASKLLAERVLWLVAKPGDNAQVFASDVKSHYDRNPPVGLNSAHAHWAFFNFIKRERRLPTKKELNIESNRIYHLIRVRAADSRIPEFGEPMKNGKFFYSHVLEENPFATNNLIWYYVCPESEWNELRWDTSNFTKALKRAGLERLPETNPSGVKE